MVELKLAQGKPGPEIEKGFDMTKEERMMKVIRGEDVDYLPSQITFSDRGRDAEICKALDLGSPDALDEFLENHIHLALTLQDKTLFYRDDVEEMERLHGMGFCTPDWENNVVYDCWGMGIQVGAGSFCPTFHPLQGKSTPEIAEKMPPDVVRESLFQDIEEATLTYKAPPMERPGNFVEMERDLAERSGDFLVVPSGYFGIFERAYALMGFQQFMTCMALQPRAVHNLVQTIADQKVKIAEKVVEMGFKVAHYGDDLGTQNGTLLSKKMFREFLLPRIAEVWEVFTKADLPIAMHSCGCIVDFLPDLIDIGLRILEPVQPCMDLAYLKHEYGKDLVFWGGIETQNILPFGTPEQVKASARETIRTLGRGGGLIIGPSQEIMNDVPIANIKALVETVIEERETVLSL